MFKITVPVCVFAISVAGLAQSSSESIEFLPRQFKFDDLVSSDEDEGPLDVGGPEEVEILNNPFCMDEQAEESSVGSEEEQSSEDFQFALETSSQGNSPQKAYFRKTTRKEESSESESLVIRTQGQSIGTVGEMILAAHALRSETQVPSVVRSASAPIAVPKRGKPKAQKFLGKVRCLWGNQKK